MDRLLNPQWEHHIPSHMSCVLRLGIVDFILFPFYHIRLHETWPFGSLNCCPLGTRYLYCEPHLCDKRMEGRVGTSYLSPCAPLAVLELGSSPPCWLTGSDPLHIYRLFIDPHLVSRRWPISHHLRCFYTLLYGRCFCWYEHLSELQSTIHEPSDFPTFFAMRLHGPCYWLVWPLLLPFVFLLRAQGQPSSPSVPTSGRFAC